MKDISADFQSLLENAFLRGLVPRRLVHFFPRDRVSGNIVNIGIWNDIEDMELEVRDGETDALVDRDYYGNLGLTVSPIVRVSDLSQQTVTIELNHLSETIQALYRTYDMRLAEVQVHDLLLDPQSRRQAAPGELCFLGLVDEASITTPSSGETGSISITAISDAIAMLNRVNPRKSSLEGQKKRASWDKFGTYSSVIATWSIPWGTKGDK